MVAFSSSTLTASVSEWVTMVGNLPALLSPGPRRRGICLMRLSEARKASYRLAGREGGREGGGEGGRGGGSEGGESME